MDMAAPEVRRRCPICGGAAGKRAFPYATRFNDFTFDYVECGTCASVFVDPVPNQETLTKMYSRESYHDAYYIGCQSREYANSAKLLRRFLPEGASVLDYGCGLGLFLRALRSEGYFATGVEFDKNTADYAANSAGCPAFSVADFSLEGVKSNYDAIHLGDVLEHLPEPAATVSELLGVLNPGGVLFVEGPLENNPSAVFWTARLYGATKRRLRPGFTGSSPPTHLLRVTEAQQLAFLMRPDFGLSRLYWDVQETGWPYAGGGALKRLVAGVAKAFGGKQFRSTTFGNRFRGVFQLTVMTPS
jgi:SAM-dependent methyltransferase